MNHNILIPEDKKENHVPTDKNKRMPVWQMVIIDIVLSVVFFGIFALYQLVIPRHLANDEIVVATAKDSEAITFELPGGSSDVIDDKTDSANASQTDESGNNSSVTVNENTNETTNKNDTDPTQENDTDTANENVTGLTNDTTNEITNENTNVTANDNTNETANGTTNETASETLNQNTNETTTGNTKENAKPSSGTKINYGNTGTSEMASDETDSASISSASSLSEEINNYKSDNIDMTTYKVELGSGYDKITYYLSDIYVTNVKYIKTAFALGEYGVNLRDSTANMAAENDAIIAISGDFYGNNETGIVIRNGTLYRAVENDADICVLFTDGTMKTYSPADFDVDEVIAQGAWQAWTFGPQLLDGNGKMLSSFNTTAYLYQEHPRSAIGYVDEGHYVFVTVDGRDPGYSRGVSLNELARIMIDAGCKTAYNLDGGKSAAMVYDDEYVNQPSDGGRTVSDIIYIGE